MNDSDPQFQQSDIECGRMHSWGDCPKCQPQPCPECLGQGSLAGYITRDMAIDGGDPNMEGSLWTEQCWACRGEGYV